jgi:hypothetical protein
MVLITIAILLIWLDWLGPRILLALLCGSLAVNHIPLLQHAIVETGSICVDRNVSILYVESAGEVMCHW